MLNPDRRLITGVVCGVRVEDIDEPTMQGIRRPRRETVTEGGRAADPGRACSLLLSKGLPGVGGEPGSVRGVHLVVDDIDAARAQLVASGVEVDEIADLGGGVRMAGFADPDGNTWAFQQLP